MARWVMLALLVVAPRVDAGGFKPVTSADKVKATATATKPDAAGKQVVTITLAIQKDWYIYANPVNHNNKFLDANRTRVKITSKENIKVEMKYPAGKTRLDGREEKYDFYEGTITIQATVMRPTGDASPLEVSVSVHGASINLGV